MLQRKQSVAHRSIAGMHTVKTLATCRSHECRSATPTATTGPQEEPDTVHNSASQQPLALRVRRAAAAAVRGTGCSCGQTSQTPATQDREAQSRTPRVPSARALHAEALMCLFQWNPCAVPGRRTRLPGRASDRATCRQMLLQVQQPTDNQICCLVRSGVVAYQQSP
jgi:hypothetical protein